MARSVTKGPYVDKKLKEPNVDGNKIHYHMPSLRTSKDGEHARGRLSVLLRMRAVREDLEASARGMLHVLLLRVRPLSV